MKKISNGRETVIYISREDILQWKIYMCYWKDNAKGDKHFSRYSSLLNRRVVLKYFNDYDKGTDGFDEIKIYDGKKEISRYNKRELKSLLNYYSIV